MGTEEREEIAKLVAEEPTVGAAASDGGVECAAVASDSGVECVTGVGDGGSVERLAVEERVLEFLAGRHPADEASLEGLTRVLCDDGEMMETLYRGLHLEERIAAAEGAAYLRGRNDVIEEFRNVRGPLPPVKEGGKTEQSDFIPLLRNMRRSVWD